jgi:toxin ParE1/3/4
MTYKIIYSPESLDDLRAIYSYIAFEKLAPQNAEGQVNRIRESIRSPHLFPEGHTTVE